MTKVIPVNLTQNLSQMTSAGSITYAGAPWELNSTELVSLGVWDNNSQHPVRRWFDTSRGMQYALIHPNYYASEMAWIVVEGYDPATRANEYVTNKGGHTTVWRTENDPIFLHPFQVDAGNSAGLVGELVLEVTVARKNDRGAFTRRSIITLTPTYTLATDYANNSTGITLAEADVKMRGYAGTEMTLAANFVGNGTNKHFLELRLTNNEASFDQIAAVRVVSCKTRGSMVGPFYANASILSDYDQWPNMNKPARSATSLHTASGNGGRYPHAVGISSATHKGLFAVGFSESTATHDKALAVGLVSVDFNTGDVVVASTITHGTTLVSGYNQAGQIGYSDVKMARVSEAKFAALTAINNGGSNNSDLVLMGGGATLNDHTVNDSAAFTGTPVTIAPQPAYGSFSRGDFTVGGIDDASETALVLWAEQDAAGYYATSTVKYKLVSGVTGTPVERAAGIVLAGKDHPTTPGIGKKMDVICYQIKQVYAKNANNEVVLMAAWFDEDETRVGGAQQYNNDRQYMLSACVFKINMVTWEVTHKITNIDYQDWGDDVNVIVPYENGASDADPVMVYLSATEASDGDNDLTYVFRGYVDPVTLDLVSVLGDVNFGRSLIGGGVGTTDYYGGTMTDQHVFLSGSGRPMSSGWLSNMTAWPHQSPLKSQEENMNRVPLYQASMKTRSIHPTYDEVFYNTVVSLGQGFFYDHVAVIGMNNDHVNGRTIEVLVLDKRTSA